MRKKSTSKLILLQIVTLLGVLVFGIQAFGSTDGYQAIIVGYAEDNKRICLETEVDGIVTSLYAVDCAAQKELEKFTVIPTSTEGSYQIKGDTGLCITRATTSDSLTMEPCTSLKHSIWEAGGESSSLINTNINQEQACLVGFKDGDKYQVSVGECTNSSKSISFLYTEWAFFKPSEQGYLIDGDKCISGYPYYSTAIPGFQEDDSLDSRTKRSTTDLDSLDDDEIDFYDILNGTGLGSQERLQDRHATRIMRIYNPNEEHDVDEIFNRAKKGTLPYSTPWSALFVFPFKDKSAIYIVPDSESYNYNCLRWALDGSSLVSPNSVSGALTPRKVAKNFDKFLAQDTALIGKVGENTQERFYFPYTYEPIKSGKRLFTDDTECQQGDIAIYGKSTGAGSQEVTNIEHVAVCWGKDKNGKVWWASKLGQTGPLALHPLNEYIYDVHRIYRRAERSCWEPPQSWRTGNGYDGTNPYGEKPKDCPSQNGLLYSGDLKVKIISSAGRYLHPDSDDKIVTSAHKDLEIQNFQLIDLNKEILRSGDYIYLKTHLGGYLAIDGSNVTSSTLIPNDYNRIKITKKDGKQGDLIRPGDELYFLFKNHNIYLAATMDTQNSVKATTDTTGPNEVFTMEYRLEVPVTIKGYADRDVYAQHQGGEYVRAGKSGSSSWDRWFVLIGADSGNGIASGGTYDIMTSNFRNYLAPNGDGTKLLARELTPANGGRFSLHKVDGTDGEPIYAGDPFMINIKDTDRVVRVRPKDRYVMSTHQTIKGDRTTFELTIPTKYFINLKIAKFNQYLELQDEEISDRGRPIKATANIPEGDALFHLIDVDGGELNSGDVVMIKLNNDINYWTIDLDSSGNINDRLSTSIQHMSYLSQFKIVKKSGSTGSTILPGDEIALRGINQKFVTASSQNRGLKVDAGRDNYGMIIDYRPAEDPTDLYGFE